MLYIKYWLMLLKSQMQYRASFLLLSTGQFLISFTAFAGLYFLLNRFGHIGGWSLHEVALIFAVIFLSYALGECFTRGFDLFSSMVASGDFDRLLVRPRGTVIQVLGSWFEFSRIGRIVQSMLVLIWAIYHLPAVWSPIKLFTVMLMILCGVCVFAGIFILTATFSFWTIQGLEIANILTDGGREMAQYPLDIYERWVFILFTFLIPFGCINYIPLLYLLDKTSGSLLHMLAPLAGVLFLVPCLAFWRFGVSYYRSTGS